MKVSTTTQRRRDAKKVGRLHNYAARPLHGCASLCVFAPLRCRYNLEVPGLRRVIIALLLILTLSSLTACNRANPSAASAGLTVTLLTDEAYPGSTLTVQISDETGRPVTDVTVSVEGNMTHAGMIPVLSESVWDGADGDEDGTYTIPFEFTMFGDWIITAKIEQRDGTILNQDFDASATLGGVSVKQ